MGEVKSRAEIRKLALDIHHGQVFTSQHVREGDEHLIPMIFMPIALMTPEQCQELVDDGVTVFYEYLSKAGMRAVNGYPSFFSVRTLRAAEASKIFRIVDKMQKAVDSFLDEDESSDDENVEQASLLNEEK